MMRDDITRPVSTVRSPNGHLAIRVVMGDDGRLWYDIIFDDGDPPITAMRRSVLGLSLDSLDAERGLTVESVGAPHVVDEPYELLVGKRLLNRSASHEQTIRLRTGDNGALHLIVRAADDGIAFRYRFPELDDAWEVRREATSFAVPPGRSWIAPYDRVGQWGPAYETLFTNGAPVGTQPSIGDVTYPGWQFPALFSVDGLWILLTESDLEASYCASHLSVGDEGTYEIAFPQAGEALGLGGTHPSGSGAFQTPWRVVMVCPSLGGIVESSLVTDLAGKRRIEDVSWIEPGRSSWSWWSDFDSSTDHDSLRSFIDLAADMGWEYSTIDANWHKLPGGDFDRLLRHADERGVRLWLWFNSGGPTNDVPEGPRDRLFDGEERRATFRWLRERGIAGVKVDFFDSDKQIAIDQYLGLLEDGADAELLLNFHGSTVPRGWDRTWPNCMTMEAVRGGEQYRLDTAWPAVAPEYNTILPFTRNAIGSMDYTPVALAGPGVVRKTTDAHELALCVVFESGILTIAGSVEAITALPAEARRFLREVPVAWDETRFVSGSPGVLAVVARRRADRWWLAGINGTDRPLPVAVDLSFLGDGEFVITVITDNKDGVGLRHTQRVVRGTEPMNLQLLAAGGFAAWAEPADDVADVPTSEAAPRSF